MRRNKALIFAALTAAAIKACDLAADVVARVDADAGFEPPGDASAPPADAAARPCYGYPTTFDVITDAGAIYAFDFATGTTTPVPRPDCNLTSGAAIAINRERDLVIADQDGFLFVAKADGGACTKSLLVSVPSAMAFQSKDGVEELFALLGTTRLVVIDPASAAVSTISVLSPAPSGTIRGLAGTVDGRLLVISKDEAGAVFISDVNPGTGVVTTITTVGRIGAPLPPGSGAFVGAAPTPAGFELVFGTGAWSYVSATTSLTFHAALMTGDVGVAGVGKWPCGP